MTPELLSQNAGEFTEKLQNRYQISQAQAYKRLSHLNIKSRKDAQGVWISADELQLMDQLNEHLKAGNPIKTFGSSQNGEESTEMIHSDPSNPSLITDNESLGTDINPEVLQVEQVTENEQAIEMINQSAQSKAAGQLILQNLLTGQYLNNPDLLAEEYRKAIAQSEAHAVPKSFDPTSYARQALGRCCVSTGQ